MDNGHDRVRILIADDYAILRAGLRKLLEAAPGFQVIGEAADGQQAAEQTRELKPDILLLDLVVSRGVRELVASSLSAHIVALTTAINEAHMLEALALGARGVLLKDSATPLLFEGIRCVMRGGYWVGGERVASLAQVVRDLGPLTSSGTKSKNFGLTRREFDIVAAVVAGYTNKDTAQNLSVSEQTVKHHLTNIFDKLGVYSRLELALFAINHQLLGED
jgi:DNA-binding NarL/FixJ family response regulator